MKPEQFEWFQGGRTNHAPKLGSSFFEAWYPFWSHAKGKPKETTPFLGFPYWETNPYTGTESNTYDYVVPFFAGQVVFFPENDVKLGAFGRVIPTRPTVGCFLGSTLFENELPMKLLWGVV